MTAISRHQRLDGKTSDPSLTRDEERIEREKGGVQVRGSVCVCVCETLCVYVYVSLCV
jgi:hypothetical protein